MLNRFFVQKDAPPRGGLLCCESYPDGNKTPRDGNTHDPDGITAISDGNKYHKRKEIPSTFNNKNPTLSLESKQGARLLQ